MNGPAGNAVQTPPGAAADPESAIYRGFVRHRRFTPRRHEFRYPLFMVFLRLDELDNLANRSWLFGTRPWHWARFRRGDYLGDAQVSLEAAVKQKIAAASGLTPEELQGDVYFYGHLRYLGFYFSPLNLYFLGQDGVMRYMVAEVSNTPWNERHYYVIDLGNLAPHAKEFHVSPFNPMQQRYTWKVTPPGGNRRKSMVHLEVSQADEKAPLFDATMVMKQRPLNHKSLLRVLLSTPAQTLSMVAGIYWQALRLYLKKVPLHAHPKRSATERAKAPGEASPRQQGP